MLQIEGFAKRYGDLQAVRPLDLEVGEGESFALLGPNGGGKTTVLGVKSGTRHRRGEKIPSRY